jgi:hypothetical protein
LLGNGLTAAAKRTRADRLSRDPLLRNPALTSNICQRLLNCRVVVLVHKGSGRGRVKGRRRTRQTCDPLLRRGRPKCSGLLQSLRGLRRDPASALNGRRLIGRRLLGRTHSTCAGRLRNTASGTHDVAHTAERLLVGANAASGRLLGRGPRSLSPHSHISGRLRRAKACAETGGARCFCAAKTGRTQGLGPGSGTCTGRVNCALRSGGRGLRGLNCAQARLPQGRACALNSAAGRVDCCSSVGPRLLCRGSRARARDLSLLPGQAADAAERRSKSRRNVPRALNGSGCSDPSLRRRLCGRLSTS